MSPTSPVWYPKVEADTVQNGSTQQMRFPPDFPFGIRTKPHKHKVSATAALKVCADSHRIRKPPRPLPQPQVQVRAPVIIHTYSPKVIHTDADDFMSLVQHLTGSSDTRLRLKRKPAGKKAASKKSVTSPKPPLPPSAPKVTGVDLNCTSPSSSQDSGDFAPTKPGKQSNSPRGPLSNFEFDADVPQAKPGIGTQHQVVKPEPIQPTTSDSFNFFTGLKPLPKPEISGGGYSYGFDMNSPALPSPLQGFLSPGWLPELSPGTAAWSQAFLDCLNGSPRAPPEVHAPLPRQKQAPGDQQGSNLVVALENIQAFMMK